MSVSIYHMASGGWQNIRDQIVAILLLLESTEGHLGAWDVLLWVLEVLELVVCQCLIPRMAVCIWLTRVSLFQVIAFCLLASV